MNEKSNKLISLLRTLDRSELRRSRKLIQSPYFGGNDKLVAFFDELVKRLGRNAVLDQKKIWRATVGAHKEYNDVRFRKYASDLFKLIQQFKIQEQLAEEPELNNYLYLASLEKGSPDKLIRGIERNWQGGGATIAGEVDHTKYLYQHLLEIRKDSLLNYEHRPYERGNYEEISHTLDLYYIVSKLKTAIDAQSRRHTEATGYTIRAVDLIVQHIENDDYYQQFPIVVIYHAMYEMEVSQQDEASFYRYKEALMKQSADLLQHLGVELIRPALNFTVVSISQGKQNFLKEYLEIYRFGLEKNMLYKPGTQTLTPAQFKNVVTVALRSGDFQFAEDYIRDYQIYIPESQRVNAVTYNSATLHFYRKEYDQAQLLLNAVEYEDINYNLNAKSMLLSIYYDTKEIDLLDYLLDTMLAFLNRHKEISRTNYEMFHNLVLYTRRLTRILPSSEKDIKQLEADLSQEKLVASRSWLQQKITELRR